VVEIAFPIALIFKWQWQGNTSNNYNAAVFNTKPVFLIFVDERQN